MCRHHCHHQITFLSFISPKKGILFFYAIITNRSSHNFLFRHGHHKMNGRRGGKLSDSPWRCPFSPPCLSVSIYQAFPFYPFFLSAIPRFNHDAQHNQTRKISRLSHHSTTRSSETMSAAVVPGAMLDKIKNTGPL